MPSTMNVAQFIDHHLNLCGKTQAQVAKECDFDKPNIITMIKQGKTKLPLGKIKVMATALHVDPLFLFRMALQEYLPEAWDVVDSLTSQPIMTENEVMVLNAVRAVGLPARKLLPSEVGPLSRAIATAVPKF